MKLKTLALLSLACLALSACDKKTSALNDFRDLTKEVTTHSKDYNVDDWKKYLKDYHEADSLINLYEYTDEEQKEIKGLESKCAAYAIKAGAIIAKESLKDLFKSAGKDIEEALGDTDEIMNDLKEGVEEVSESANEAIGTAKDAIRGFIDAMKDK